MNSTKTIFDRLTSLSSITTRLDVRNGAPAIFNDRAPDDFVFGSKAVLIIAAPELDDDASTFTEKVRAVGQSIRIYGRDTGSTAEIDDLARDVRDAFHLQAANLAVTGGTVTTSVASGPAASPTSDPSLIGRRVSVRLELQET